MDKFMEDWSHYTIKANTGLKHIQDAFNLEKYDIAASLALEVIEDMAAIHEQAILLSQKKDLK